MSPRLLTLPFFLLAVVESFTLIPLPRHHGLILAAVYETNGGARPVEAEPTISSVTDAEAVRLKEELYGLAETTERGFSATKSERDTINDIIYSLAKYNPTAEPLAPYYDEASSVASPSLAGKWTLIYTDAPDITTLDNTPTAKLGRIGQECEPPYVKNVIEWKRPEWASALPFSGSDDSRVLQKVCTKGQASPNNPMILNLVLAGIELVTDDDENGRDVAQLADVLVDKGLPAGLLSFNPIKLEGPLTAPFGQCEVLYLDEEMRIIKTGQNFIAVNKRDRQEWF